MRFREIPGCRKSYQKHTFDVAVRITTVPVLQPDAKNRHHEPLSAASPELRRSDSASS